MTEDSAKKSCLSCRRPKADAACDVCAAPVCRSCAILLPEDTFSFWSEPAPLLRHSRYCPACHTEHVEPELARYEELMERAKNVAFITKAYRGTLPLLKQAKVEVAVADCRDRDELIMRLAFRAAELGYNALIRAEVVGRKVRNHGYQKTLWSGHALPAMIDAEKLALEEYREEVWRRGK